MAKKPPKTAAPPPLQTPADIAANAAPRTRVREQDAWLAGAAPWEDYGRESIGGPEGLAALAEEGESEVLIGTIEDDGAGKVKTTQRVVPAGRLTAGLREGNDGMLRTKKTRGVVAAEQLSALREDGFATGDSSGGRVIFSADAFYYVLMTDDNKYRAMQNSYKFYREDPLFRGLVNSLINYTIGTGLKFKALDEDPAVQAYLEEFWELNEMDGQDREIVLRWFLTGEIAMRFLPKGVSGVDAQFPAVRLIPFWRLAEVMKDENDAEKIDGFVVWQASGPYKPMAKMEQVPADEMLFIKNGTKEEDRGEPPLLAVMRPCKWYQDWMNNRVMQNRYRSSVVLFKKIVTGTPGKVQAVSAADPAAANHTGQLGKVEKRLPKPGTVITHNDKIEYDWKHPNLGAADAGEDGRKILLYVCAAAQVPEFLLGDASNANLASTFVAENPFLRQIESHRDMFEHAFKLMFKRVIEHGVKTGKLKANSTETKVAEGSKWLGKARMLLKRFGLTEAKTDDKGNLTETKAVPTNTKVAVEWPNLLHKNGLEDAQMMQIHQNMGIASRETLCGEAGRDWDVERERLEEDKDADMDTFAAQRDAEISAGNAQDGDASKAQPGAKKTDKGAV